MYECILYAKITFLRIPWNKLLSTRRKAETWYIDSGTDSQRNAEYLDIFCKLLGSSETTFRLEFSNEVLLFWNIMSCLIEKKVYIDFFIEFWTPYYKSVSFNEI